MNFNEAFERFGLSTEYHAIIKDLNEIKTLYQFLMVARRIIAFADKINLESSRLIGRNEAIVERNQISIEYNKKAMSIEQTIVPNVESAREQGYWIGAATQAQASEEFMNHTTLDNEAMHMMYEALDSLFTALDKIEKNKRKLVPFKNDPAWIAAAKEPMQELGVQQGPSYFHDPKQPYYSGAQNPPQRPSATDLLPGRKENPEISQCYCLYCHQYIVVKQDAADGKVKCEDQVHLKCNHMLTTVTKIANDPRPNSDDLATRAKHPHSGVREASSYIFYKCHACNKVSQIQAPLDVRNENDKLCPFCLAKLTSKDVIDDPAPPAKQ